MLKLEMINKRKNKRIIFVGSVFVLSVLSLAFVVTNFRDNMVFFYSPTELANVETLQKISGKKIRVGGLVKENSVQKIDAMNVQFVVTDYEKELKINYRGLMPDLFREGQGVVAKGNYNTEENEFFSTELLIKHDEKYVPPAVQKSLKK